MEQEKSIVQLAYEILKPIPKENWVTGMYVDKNGNCCAIGHFNKAINQMEFKEGEKLDWERDNASISSKEIEFRLITERFVKDKTGLESNYQDGVIDIIKVNDQCLNGWNEDHPKDRVLHLLEDMIKEGY